MRIPFARLFTIGLMLVGAVGCQSRSETQTGRFFAGASGNGGNSISFPYFGFSASGSSSHAERKRHADRRKIDHIVARHALQQGVPVSLARAVVRVESNYRPNARGRAGEVGLMQIKPSTARAIGYRGSIRDLYRPETNIKWGMKYLGQARRLSRGDTCGTAMRYNAGLAAKRHSRGTRNYCRLVKRHM